MQVEKRGIKNLNTKKEAGRVGRPNACNTKKKNENCNEKPKKNMCRDAHPVCKMVADYFHQT